MAQRGRPPKVKTTTTDSPAMVIEASPVTGAISVVSQTVDNASFPEGIPMIHTPIEPLPAQPISRLRLLEVLRDQLKTADGKNGIATVIAMKSYLNEMAEEVDDQTLLNTIFKYVMDGDERFIVRRYFSNIQ